MGDEVAAVRAGDQLAEDARVLVGEDNRHAREDAALRIGDLATDLGSACLRTRQRRCNQGDAEDQTECEFTHLSPPVEIKSC